MRKKGRHSSAVHPALHHPSRIFDKEELAGVILGCTNRTEQECLQKRLFGLPGNHYSYIELITPGLPLFLFNYEERTLSGVFRAASNGGFRIDPFAWSPDYSVTKFPAQVRIEVWQQCPPLSEAAFKPILLANYFTGRKFSFELDHPQTQGLLACFGFSPARPPLIQPLPTAVHLPFNMSPLQHFHPPFRACLAASSVAPLPIPAFSLPADLDSMTATNMACINDDLEVLSRDEYESNLRRLQKRQKQTTQAARMDAAAWEAPHPFAFYTSCEEVPPSSGHTQTVTEGTSFTSVAAILGGFHSRLQSGASHFFEQAYRDRISKRLYESMQAGAQEIILRELVQEEVERAHVTCQTLVKEVKAAALAEGMKSVERMRLQGPYAALIEESALRGGLARFEASALAYVERAKEKGRTVIFTSNEHYLRDSLRKAQVQLRKRYGVPSSGELQIVESLQSKVGAYWRVLQKRLADEIPIELKFTLQQELQLSPDSFDRLDTVGNTGSQQSKKRKR